jgi:hypothetical protein
MESAPCFRPSNFICSKPSHHRPVDTNYVVPSPNPGKRGTSFKASAGLLGGTFGVSTQARPAGIAKWKSEPNTLPVEMRLRRSGAGDGKQNMTETTVSDDKVKQR